MSKPILLNESLVFLDIHASSREEALQVMTGNLLEQGLVLDTYPQAVLDREQTYATGLPGDAFAVAIPHTDTIHVVSDAISIGILDTPVSFNMMGTDDMSLEVEMIFLLAIKNAENQVIMLQSLMELFQDAKALNDLKASPDKETLIRLFKKSVNLKDGSM